MKTLQTNKLTPPNCRGLSTHLHNTSYCTNICFSLHMRSSDLDKSLLQGSKMQPWWAWKKTPTPPPAANHCVPGGVRRKEEPLSTSLKERHGPAPSWMVKRKITGISAFFMSSIFTLIDIVKVQILFFKTNHSECKYFFCSLFQWLLVLLFQPVSVTTQS